MARPRTAFAAAFWLRQLKASDRQGLMGNTDVAAEMGACILASDQDRDQFRP